MLNASDINEIKKRVEEFFEKMTIMVSKIESDLSSAEDKEVVDLAIELEEAQIIIGQGGQTLSEIQRLLRTILNKKMEKVFYLNLDVNGYKKKKIEYPKGLAKELADEVALSKEEKVLLPMPAYERRIIHAELAQRTDVITESHGEDMERHIIIKPK